MINTGSDGIHEVFNGDVQYPFADIGETKLLHISSVTPENRKSHTYTCPYCKKELRPRLGTKRKHCFAHKPNESCELDRYIHSTAERLLKEKWDSDLPFEIRMTVHSQCENRMNCFFQQSTCTAKKIETFDLKEWYSQCLVEKKVGEFIPDLCLIDETGKHDPIFIEIWSKHQNSTKKQTSDYKIIEIRLRTIQELEELPKRPITESDNVTFSHFKTVVRKPKEFPIVKLMKYRLYGRTLLSHVFSEKQNCLNYKDRHPSSVLEIVSYWDAYYPSYFQRSCTAVAIKKGFNARICFDCKHYGDDYRTRNSDVDWRYEPEKPQGCRRSLEELGLLACIPNDAKTCDHFQLRETIKQNVQFLFSNMRLYIWTKNSDGSESEDYIE